MATKSPHKTSETPAFSLISNEKLLQMYVAMLKCRLLDSHLRSLGRSSSSKGKEAVFVASCIDLLPEDAVIDSSHAGIVSFLKGTPLPSILGQPSLNGKPPASKRKISRSADSVAECAIATGIAYAHLPKNPQSIALAFLSANPASSEAARSALFFAGTQKLPVIYVYAGRESLNVNSLDSLGFAVIPVEGNDVVAVYRVMFECAARTRRGGGPSVIACDFSASNKIDPIRNMENYLSAKGLFRKGQKLPGINAFERDLKRFLRAPKDTPANHALSNIFFV